jgi:hypothetical protein
MATNETAKPTYVIPTSTRSRVMTEVASELVCSNRLNTRQARISLRKQGAKDWDYVLFGSDTPAAIDEVARGDVHFAILNPAGPLVMAVRGTGPYKSPLPLRAITVIPSYDQFVFAVAAKTGLTTLDEVRERRYPLRVSVRGQMDHSNHFYTEQVLAVCGFSLADIVSWGGRVQYDPGLPNGQGLWRDGSAKISTRLDAVERGEINAIFDEAMITWAHRAAELDMRFLELGEHRLQQLEALGLRRGPVTREQYPQLPNEVVGVDYSGWPIYTHANVSDHAVEEFCQALHTRKDQIPWEFEGPLPLERMVKEAIDTPQDVPLHPGAERFWRKCGYL